MVIKVDDIVEPNFGRKKAALAFARAFHEDGPAIYLLISDKKGVKKSVREFYGRLRDIGPKLDSGNKEGYGVFMATSTHNGKVRGSEYVTKVNALFIDKDDGCWNSSDLQGLISKFPVEPYMVVETSPGKFHVYWFVLDIPLDDYPVLQKQLAKKFSSDSCVHDLTRVMRVPGFVHHKGVPYVSKIIYYSDDQTPMSLNDFRKLMFEEGCGDDIIEDDRNHAPDCSDSNSWLVDRLADIPADERPDWAAVGMAIKNELGDDGLKYFISWSKKSPKFNHDEAIRQWKSFKVDGSRGFGTIHWLAKQYGAESAGGYAQKQFPNTPIELADFFVNSISENCKYSEQEKSWYSVKYGQWVCSDKAAERHAVTFLKELLRKVTKGGTTEQRALLNRYQSHAAVREILGLAASNPDLHIDHNAFDTNPLVIGVKIADEYGALTQGVIDLESFEVRAALPEDRISRSLGATYDKNANAPRWEQFISQVTGGDADLATALQNVFGYLMFGHTKAQILFILIGSGANGKGVFVGAMNKLMGNYAVSISHALLKPGAMNPNSPSPALVALKGCRVWTCSEFPKGVPFDEPLVKRLSGSDPISCRGLYGDQQVFTPVGKLVMASNDMPRITYNDKAMWRRIYPIPFNEEFYGKSRDPDLEEKLTAELPGILNWAIKGAAMYAKDGKVYWSDASKKMLRRLQADVDSVGTWIKEYCKENDQEEVQSSVAYESYSQYMKADKSRQVSIKDFKQNLIGRGFFQKKTNKGNFYIGFNIKPMA